MLRDATVYATVAVHDLEVAKEFYTDILGLRQVNSGQGGVMYESGGGRLFVYQSTTAGTNEATCAAWEVADVEEVVEALKSKGVRFERYEFPGATTQGDISVRGSQKTAWFNDPDGNILAVGSVEEEKESGLLDHQTQV